MNVAMAYLSEVEGEFYLSRDTRATEEILTAQPFTLFEAFPLGREIDILRCAAGVSPIIPVCAEIPEICFRQGAARVISPRPEAVQDFKNRFAQTADIQEWLDNVLYAD